MPQHDNFVKKKCNIIIISTNLFKNYFNNVNHK